MGFPGTYGTDAAEIGIRANKNIAPRAVDRVFQRVKAKARFLALSTIVPAFTGKSIIPPIDVCRVLSPDTFDRLAKIRRI